MKATIYKSIHSLAYLLILTSSLSAMSSRRRELKAYVRPSVESIGLGNQDHIEKEYKKWERAGFKNIEITRIDLLQEQEDRGLSHAFDLNILFLRGSGWTLQQLISRYRFVADIYAKQCHIGIENTQFIEVDPIDGIVDFSDPSKLFPEGSAYEFVKKIPSPYRTTAIHVSSLASGIAGNAGSLKYYYWSPHEYLNRVWITNLATDMEYNHRYFPEDHSTEAHELAHNLLNDGHSSPYVKNLMSKLAIKRVNIFNKDQCKRMKSNKYLVRKL